MEMIHFVVKKKDTKTDPVSTPPAPILFPHQAVSISTADTGACHRGRDSKGPGTQGTDRPVETMPMPTSSPITYPAARLQKARE